MWTLVRQISRRDRWPPWDEHRRPPRRRRTTIDRRLTAGQTTRADGPRQAPRTFVPGIRDRGRGHVVNFASTAGKDGNPNPSVYSRSKAAVIGPDQGIGKELATSKVLINAIAPNVGGTSPARS
ncbi:SDR family NAD(P)-dependent oxidoreductase [Actinomadura nitritigenes]|uniref:SDR family NAD(P)-dependent oxidoreductase n=1 Tax=Actinomadura nitritigenes TaxID=134602 RepID=UPI003D92AB9D